MPAAPAGKQRPGDETGPDTSQAAENLCPRGAGTGRLGRHACPDCQDTGRLTTIVGDA